MTKSDLRNGMFGKMNDGDIFVVVDDKLIYEGGQLNLISEMSENMEFGDDAKVIELYEARCFNQVKDGRGKLIWKRTEPKVEAKEEAKGEKTVVTITEDEFFEVVKKANEIFMEVGEEVPGSELAQTMMGLQNITFGAVIASVLFNKEIK
jgi:hypothetical protein